MILLGSYSPTAASAQTVIGTMEGTLVGKSGLTLAAVANGLTSGSTVTVFFQGELGAGWYDIGALAFTTGSAAKDLTIRANGVSSAITRQALALTGDTAAQGWIPDRIRAIAVSTGTYSAGSVAAYFKPYP